MFMGPLGGALETNKSSIFNTHMSGNCTCYIVPLAYFQCTCEIANEYITFLGNMIRESKDSMRGTKVALPRRHDGSHNTLRTTWTHARATTSGSNTTERHCYNHEDN
jgi:hypothetical protein